MDALADLLTLVGVAVVALGLGGLTVALIHLARDWAEDRRREARYAAEWAAAHREHQDRGRYLTSDPNRPE